MKRLVFNCWIHGWHGTSSLHSTWTKQPFAINKLACSQCMGLHSSNGRALQCTGCICNCLKIAIATVTIISLFKNLSFHSSHHLHVSFLSGVKTNSTKWSAPILCMGLHSSKLMLECCSCNGEAMGSNPVEAPPFSFGGGGGICNCLNCNYHCDDHIFI